MTEKFNIGNYRRDVQKLEDREITWRLKFELMSRELKELISVIHLHRAALKDNIYAKPHIITRTVGLQTVGVITCSKTECWEKIIVIYKIY